MRIVLYSCPPNRCLYFSFFALFLSSSLFELGFLSWIGCRRPSIGAFWHIWMDKRDFKNAVLSFVWALFFSRKDFWWDSLIIEALFALDLKWRRGAFFAFCFSSVLDLWFAEFFGLFSVLDFFSSLKLFSALIAFFFLFCLVSSFDFLKLLDFLMPKSSFQDSCSFDHSIIASSKR